jgi:hypothetical protein
MKCRKTFEKMEIFSFVTPITGLNRPDTGKEDDDDDDDDINSMLTFTVMLKLAPVLEFMKNLEIFYNH